MSLDNIKPRNTARVQNGSMTAESVSDRDTQELLCLLVDEVRIMNLHLSTITDTIFTKGDLSE